MSDPAVTLHMICGKIAAGKSTLAAQLADAENTVLIAEDAWLSALFGEQMQTPADFVHYSAKLRNIMGPHVVALLNAGTSVVLDFQANTVESRRWMQGILQQTNAAHLLHVLVPPDAECLARLHARNAAGTHPFTVTDEQFRQVSKYFTHPTPDEGFDLKIHS